jgi:N-acetyltransferase
MAELGFRGPITLTGHYVELVPLAPAHRVPLRFAARDPEVRRLLRNGPGSTLEEMDGLIAKLLRAEAEGTDLPFTTLSLPERRPIGMTRFLRIEREDRSVEVGGTWLDSTYWRTPINTESKYLLFRHAFEVERVHRVQLQTDLRNERSQRAIERLGAVREAVLREDVLLPGPYYRSSVIYSILEAEWPAVKRRLEGFLEKPWVPVVPSGSIGESERPAPGTSTPGDRPGGGPA